MTLKKFLLTGVFLLISLFLRAQSAEDIVSWRHEVTPTATENIYEVVFTASITPPWHMYDLGPYKGGPNPTTFEFAKISGVETIGKTEHKIQPKRIQDEMFGMEIGYFAERAAFVQKFRVTSGTPVKLEGTVTYQLCDDQSCLAPTEYGFTVGFPAARPGTAQPEGTETDSAAPAGIDPGRTAEPVITPPSAPDNVRNTIPGPALQATADSSTSLWKVIIEAILWGLAAFLTPCVFPMAPMTVSFFLKSNANKARGRFMASMYGLFIVLLYTLPIAILILATFFIGGENVTTGIFNWIATHWLPNVLFSIIFLVFAASFFGAFEIRLPTKLVDKADAKSDKGGLIGVLFMALTLVLVSFSCTGPIVSSVLLKSTRGEIWEPIVTMLAFSIAFALPFTLLAFFPSVLKNMPRSGGWLNSVKVTLGFVEIALGLKFLSIADQTYHWGLLDREIYLAIWIVVFALLGFYLLGKIKFKHDSEVKYIGVFRLTLIITVFSFVAYLIPGMWGAPLKALSGYLPPMHTQDFVLGSVQGGSAALPPAGAAADRTEKVKYGDFLHLPHGLDGFFDYQQGMEYARRAGKPVFIDITGHGCVNCREMEARVWSDPEVLNLLRNEYVIIALYVDDKTRLPEEDWVTSGNGKVLKGLGQINADFSQKHFGTSAQPFYVLLDNDGNRLTSPRGYNLDVQAFVAFLKEGLEAYRK